MSEQIDARVLLDAIRDVFPPRRKGVTCLTAREVETAGYLVEGLTGPQIADRMVVSMKTVDAHKRHLVEKAGLAGSPLAGREVTRRLLRAYYLRVGYQRGRAERMAA